MPVRKPQPYQSLAKVKGLHYLDAHNWFRI